MFTEVKKIIANHAGQIDSMKAALAEQKKTIYQDNDYSMSYKDKQFAEAKEKYDADRLALINQSRTALDDAYAAIFTKLEDAITAEIGQETISELQMLSDMTVSEFEITAYAKKFAGKYKALRLLNKVAEKNDIPFTYVTDDDIVCDLNTLKGDIVNLFNIYDGEKVLLKDYKPRYVLLSATDSVTDNLFVKIEAEFKDFMNPFVGTRPYNSMSAIVKNG